MSRNFDLAGNFPDPFMNPEDIFKLPQFEVARPATTEEICRLFGVFHALHQQIVNGTGIAAPAPSTVINFDKDTSSLRIDDLQQPSAVKRYAVGPEPTADAPRRLRVCTVENGLHYDEAKPIKRYDIHYFWFDSRGQGTAQYVESVGGADERQAYIEISRHELPERPLTNHDTALLSFQYGVIQSLLKPTLAQPRSNVADGYRQASRQPDSRQS